MSIPVAISQLLEVESSRVGGILEADKTLAIAMSRVGSQTDGEQRIIAGTLSELAAHDPSAYGDPLHSLVIVGKRLHELEVEYAGIYAVNQENWRDVAKAIYGCNLG